MEKVKISSAHQSSNRSENKSSHNQNCDEWSKLDLVQLQAKLKTSSDGLSQADATQRLAQYGPNELVEEKPNLSKCLFW